MRMGEVDLIVIGDVVRVQGNKGEVKVAISTDMPRRFETLRHVIVIGPDGESSEKEIGSVRYHKDRWVILKFKDSSYSEARSLVGARVCIPREQRPRLGEDSFYYDEIIGLEVYTEAGENLGKITDIITTGANDVYVIEDKHLIPATKEVVKGVDTENGRMLIHLIEGLV